MIVCPACQAENPDGTKICVKCATELPKPAAKGTVKATGVASPKGYDPTHLKRDLVDVFWLLLIIALIVVGFIWTATGGKWDFTEVDEAKIVEAPVIVKAVRPKHASSVKKSSVEPIGEEPAVQYGNPEKFYQKGKDQYDSKHYQASFNYLRQALEIDPTFAKAYFGIGYLYYRFNMNDEAVRMYEMALRFDPNHADSINNLAMRYSEAGNYDDAADLLRRAVVLDSQNADYEYNLGSIYLEKKQPQEALRSFQTAASLRPNDVSIMSDLALTYENLGMKQEALDSWQKVMQFADSPEMLQQAQTHLFYLQSQS